MSTVVTEYGSSPLAKRAFLLVGAAGGIGSETARSLVLRGARVFLAGRNFDRLATLGQELAAPWATVDARDFDAVEALFRRAKSELGALDGVVNMAGSILIKAAHQTSLDEFQDTLAQNLTTAFATVRAAGRTLRGEGVSIVLMASAAARTGLANHEAIAAAKGGVIALTLSAAASYAGTLRFNCVAPGLTRTPLSRALLSNETSEKASLALHPAGRLGEPRDVAAAIVFLLDPANDWITGQVVGVDGGLSTIRPRARL